MRAMVYRGPYKIRVEEKDVPQIEHPNDAIVIRRVQPHGSCPNAESSELGEARVIPVWGRSGGGKDAMPGHPYEVSLR